MQTGAAHVMKRFRSTSPTSPGGSYCSSQLASSCTHTHGTHPKKEKTWFGVAAREQREVSFGSIGNAVRRDPYSDFLNSTVDY